MTYVMSCLVELLQGFIKRTIAMDSMELQPNGAGSGHHTFRLSDWAIPSNSIKQTVKVRHTLLHVYSITFPLAGLCGKFF